MRFTFQTPEKDESGKELPFGARVARFVKVHGIDNAVASYKVRIHLLFKMSLNLKDRYFVL